MNFGFLYTREKTSINLANWMSLLPDSTNLNRLLIPGTHNSVLWGKKSMFSSLFRYQEKTIFEQLKSGVRFLDIKAKQVKGNLITKGSNKDFQEILESCYSFLKEHPNECVYLSLTEDQNSFKPINDFQTSFLNYIYHNKAKYPIHEYWYLDSSGLPCKTKPCTLSEVRGKLILLRKFNGVIGVDWNSAQLATQEVHKSMNNSEHPHFPPNTNPTYTAKWNIILSYFNYSVNDKSGYKLFINFTSIVHKWLPNIRKASQTVNSYIQSYLNTYKPYNIAGIVVMDFPSNDVLSSIINLTLKSHGFKQKIEKKVYQYS